MSDIINNKEKLMIEYLVSDVEIFAYCYGITKEDYFSPPLNRAVSFVLEHFQKYGKLASIDIIQAETNITLKKRLLPDDELNYFIDEYEAFCRQQAMAKAILESVDLVQAGDTIGVEKLIREAMLVKLDKSIGTNVLDGAESRILQMADLVIDYSTGIDEIDEMIGKIRRGELIIVTATSSGGKSLWLANTAIALAKQHLNVAVITLELNEQLYSKRFDVMLTGTDIKSHKQNAKSIGNELDKLNGNIGNITVKYMHPRSTASDFRAYMLEYSLVTGNYPDVLLVDYIGIMGTVGKKHSNKFDEDEEKAIELRRIASEFDLICLSAQQLNRSAADIVDVNYGHVAGGISLINTSDAAIALVASEEDLDNNQVQAKGLKVRNAARNSKPVTIYKCPTSLRMSGNPFTQPKQTNSTKQKMLDAMK